MIWLWNSITTLGSGSLTEFVPMALGPPASVPVDGGVGGQKGFQLAKQSGAMVEVLGRDAFQHVPHRHRFPLRAPRRETGSADGREPNAPSGLNCWTEERTFRRRRCCR
jgi:hypothetical protein